MYLKREKEWTDKKFIESQNKTDHKDWRPIAYLNPTCFFFLLSQKTKNKTKQKKNQTNKQKQKTIKKEKL